MPSILLVGTATLDLVFGLGHHPEADEEMRAESLRICRGGNAANSAIVLANLGRKADFLGVLAEAPETAVIERDFAAHGVGYGQCPRLPGRPPTSSIYLSGAQRSIVHYRDLPELDAGHLVSMDLSAYDWLHFEGRNVPQLTAMLTHVKDRFPRMRISLELEKPRPGIEGLFGMADLLLCSRGFALHHGYKQPPAFLQWMREKSPSASIVAAWGEEGAYGLAPDEGVCHADAAEVVAVIDTLGAGDTFNAGMIDACRRGQPLAQALVNACALAGRKCAVTGFDFQQMA